MSKTFALLSLELRSAFGINKLLHTKEPAERRRGILIACVYAFLAVIAVGYVSAYVWALCSFGLDHAVPAYLVAISSLLVFFFGIFRAGQTIFSRGGYDLLAALPLREEQIVTSRFVAMYIEDAVLSLLILLSGGITYGIVAHPDPIFYLMLPISWIFIPVLPLIISTLLGTLLIAISSRMVRGRGIVLTLLSVALVVGVLAGSLFMGTSTEKITSDMIAELIENIGELIGKIYPPAWLLGNAMLGESYLGGALFAVVSIVFLLLSLLILRRIFVPVMRRLSVSAAKGNFKLGERKARALRLSLLEREAKRYFSSAIYVTNTIIGPVMAALAAVAIWIFGVDKVSALFPINIKPIIPIAVSAVFCMMPTTSASISAEGKQVWVIKSLPISMRAWLDGKILLYLVLCAPFYIVAEVFLTLALAPSPIEFLWQLLIPAVMILFIAVTGIAVDLKFHRFDWNKEEQVVKQGASTGVGGFAGLFISSLLCAVLILTPSEWLHIVRLGICAAIFAATMVIYSKNNRAKFEML